MEHDAPWRKARRGEWGRYGGGKESYEDQRGSHHPRRRMCLRVRTAGLGGGGTEDRSGGTAKGVGGDQGGEKDQGLTGRLCEGPPTVAGLGSGGSQKSRGRPGQARGRLERWDEAGERG